VFVAGNGQVKGFSVGEAAEVKGGAPSILIEIGRQIVVAIAALALHEIGLETSVF
jgi:hypothetical protein